MSMAVQQYYHTLWDDAEELRWAARHWATRIGVDPATYTLRAMRLEWDSISTKGRLTINTDLVNLP